MPSAKMAASTLRQIAHKNRSYHSIFRIAAVRILALFLLPAAAVNDSSFGKTSHRGVRAWISARSFTDQMLLLIHHVDGLFAQTACALPSSLPASQMSEEDALGGIFWQEAYYGSSVNGSSHDARGEPFIDLSRPPLCGERRSLADYAKSAMVSAR